MAQERAKILVVDDNEMNREVLSRRLERQGYAIELAEDGEQALSMIHARSFDLVLLDIMMPKVNGYQVLEQLKAERNSTPVIVISAMDELDSVVRCVELGAEDYLFKPFNPVLLKARVNATLEKKRLLDQARRSASSPLDVQMLRANLEQMGQHLQALETTTTLADEPRSHVIALRSALEQAASLVGK